MRSITTSRGKDTVPGEDQIPQISGFCQGPHVQIEARLFNRSGGGASGDCMRRNHPFQKFVAQGGTIPLTSTVLCRWEDAPFSSFWVISCCFFRHFLCWFFHEFCVIFVSFFVCSSAFFVSDFPWNFWRFSVVIFWGDSRWFSCHFLYALFDPLALFSRHFFHAFFVIVCVIFLAFFLSFLHDFFVDIFFNFRQLGASSHRQSSVQESSFSRSRPMLLHFTNVSILSLPAKSMKLNFDRLKNLLVVQVCTLM